MNHSAKSNKLSETMLTPDQLRRFFVSHLNRIHCVKAHLAERLPELAEQADFRDLKHAIQETCEDIVSQIARIEEIYTLLDEEASLENCDELIDFIEAGFNSIRRQSGETGLRDLSVLFYLSNIESIEVASFQLLQLAAVKLADKQIRQLLKENFDESKADRALFLQITAKYFN